MRRVAVDFVAGSAEGGPYIDEQPPACRRADDTNRGPRRDPDSDSEIMEALRAAIGRHAGALGGAVSTAQVAALLYPDEKLHPIGGTAASSVKSVAWGLWRLAKQDRGVRRAGTDSRGSAIWVLAEEDGGEAEH
jgi:hypothetical protein